MGGAHTWTECLGDEDLEFAREDDDAFVSLVKGMAIDDRMDFEAARQIIDAYRQLMGRRGDGNECGR